VRHRLPSCLARIDSHIEIRRTPTTSNDLTYRIDGAKEFGTFFDRGIEPCANVPVGNDQGMAIGDRESIPECEDVREAEKDACSVSVAKGAEGGQQ
jgi:hypothetical protein